MGNEQLGNEQLGNEQLGNEQLVMNNWGWNLVLDGE
jgi:hypothetical protein